MTERIDEIKALLAEWDAAVAASTNERPRGFSRLVRLMAEEIEDMRVFMERLEEASKVWNAEIRRLGSPSRDLIGPGPNQPLFVQHAIGEEFNRLLGHD